MKIHELKILPQYFKEVVNGNKTFEIRENDRGFLVGDKLILKEFSHDKIIYTGNETTKEISYIYEGEEYGLKKGWCVLGLKQEGIILTNINLTGITVLEQIDKVREEEKEFAVAIELHDKENAIEEFWDNMQSKLGLLEKEFGISADQVMEEYPKHLEKIKNRPRIKLTDKNNYDDAEE